MTKYLHELPQGEAEAEIELKRRAIARREFIAQLGVLAPDNRNTDPLVYSTSSERSDGLHPFFLQFAQGIVRPAYRSLETYAQRSSDDGRFYKATSTLADGRMVRIMGL